MNYNESYDEWADEVGIFKDSESMEAWEHQQKKIDALMQNTNNDWRWYLVIDEQGNVDEAFNSLDGAEDWKVRNGGNIIKVKEDKS